MSHSDPIAQARAEGFRDGLERAARKCREHQEVANGRAAAAAKAGQSHVWSRYASALEEAELLEAAIRALAPQQEIEAGAKATDPRGSGLPGGGDATEDYDARRTAGSLVHEGRTSAAELETALLSAYYAGQRNPPDNAPPTQPERSGGEGK